MTPTWIYFRCLCYYVDIYEDNNKDHVKSKTFVGCLGNMAAKDSKSTPLMHFEVLVFQWLFSDCLVTA